MKDDKKKRKSRGEGRGDGGIEGRLIWKERRIRNKEGKLREDEGNIGIQVQQRRKETRWRYSEGN